MTTNDTYIVNLYSDALEHESPLPLPTPSMIF